ncbi:MAG: plastocyanin [Nitrospinales bacterium]|jgi:plastocyanin
MYSILLNINKIIFFTALFIFFISGFAQAHHLNGKIEVEGGKNLKNLIIYLEPADSSKLKLEPKLHKILQKGRQFNPDLLVVSPGDKVQFLNDEDREIDHNIYSLSRLKNFDLGLGERGSILDVTIDKNGSGNFYCSVHKLMEGRMISLNTRYFTVLERPGKFTFPNIPSGDWVVKVFVFHRRYKAIPVNITLNASSHEDIELKVVKK